jgi:hypothetical protein
MRYMLTVHATKDSEEGRPPDPRLKEAIGQYAEELTKSGVVVGIGGLAPSSYGSRVRVANGKITVTDGPFTEAKEILGGYIIVDVKTMEEAVELSRRFWQLHTDILGPSFVGSGEIRPVHAPGECGQAPEK